MSWKASLPVSSLLLLFSSNEYYVPAQQVVARGSCHSNEGLKLEEVALRAEDAKLLLRGGLLGPHQNATLMLTDFPVALLQPLFRWASQSCEAVPCLVPPVKQCVSTSGFTRHVFGHGISIVFSFLTSSVDQGLAIGFCSVTPPAVYMLMMPFGRLVLPGP